MSECVLDQRAMAYMNFNRYCPKQNRQIVLYGKTKQTSACIQEKGGCTARRISIKDAFKGGLLLSRDILGVFIAWWTKYRQTVAHGKIKFKQLGAPT